MDSNFSLNDTQFGRQSATFHPAQNSQFIYVQNRIPQMKNVPLNEDNIELSSKNKPNSDKNFIQKVQEYFNGNTKEKQTRRNIAIAAGVVITGAAVYLFTHGRKGANLLPAPKAKSQAPAFTSKPKSNGTTPISKTKSQAITTKPKTQASVAESKKQASVTKTVSVPTPTVSNDKQQAHNFSHDPLFRSISCEELDAEINNVLNSVALNKAFDDKITSEADLRAVIAKVFTNCSSWDTNKIISYYKKNPDTAEILRYLSPSNFDGAYVSSFRICDLLDIMESNSVASLDAFKDFLKIKKNYDKSLINRTAYIGSEYEKYLENPKAAKRTIARMDLINRQLGQGNTFGIELINPFEIMYSGDKDGAIEFLLSLEKGHIEDELALVNLLKNSHFNPKKGTKFLRSLKKDVMERIGIETIEGVTTLSYIDGKKLSKKLNRLPSDVLAKLNYDADMLSFARFADLYGINSINALNMEQKKNLVSVLVRNNSDSFAKETSELFPLIPKNQQEYCNILTKLTRSIGIDTKPLTEAEQKAFEAGLKNAASNISKANLDDVHFALDIPRQDFIQKARKAMEGLDDAEKNKVMDYFGFELQDIVPNKSNGLKHTLHTMKGYPINVNNGKKLAEIESAETKKVIEDVRKIVQEFSENNGVKLVSKNGVALTPEQKALEADLNEIFKGLPELRSIIGRKQHQTHVFSLDEHTFRVFQGVTQNPKFEKLSDSDKKVLSIASLLHDVTKAEGLRDAMHPTESAFDAFHITQKLNLSEDERVKVYELIKSHNWLDKMCAKTKDGAALPAQKVQELAQDVAFDARHTNTFDLAKILCEADMKAVKPNGAFFEKHKGSFDEMSAYVDKYLENIHNTQIILPQTRIPKASAIKNGVQKTADGVTNTVLYMDDIKGDMSKYGFKKGTTKENWRGLVHALDDKNQMSKFDTFSLIDSDALLSTSYIDANNYKVFRKQGFVLDVDYNDIHAGYYKDFGTGCKKDIELLKSDYLFHGDRKSFDDRTKYRKYISSLIKKEMGITNDTEYTNMVKQIQSAKSITEIREINPKLADALDNVFSSMEAGKRRGDRQYNEMLASRPKIQAVFGYDKEYESIPKFLREYAQDNDIPILIFGKSSSVA